MEQAGLRKGHRARHQIASVSESLTAERSATRMSICFTDYTKDFHSVQHLKCGTALEVWEYPSI
jgi:hypothetical protein